MSAEALQRAYEREKEKRVRAEQLLEDRSRELFQSYEDLRASHDELILKQKQLVQSEKMASLGIISAGVAHEINNPIGFVLSNIRTLGENTQVFTALCEKLKLLIEKSESGASTGDDIQSIAEYAREEDLEFLIEDGETLIGETIEGIERVRDIVAGLKSFARVDNDEKEMASINECIESTLKLLNNQTKYACTVETALGDIPSIACYPGKLNQVFMNLIVNASQALEGDNGTITITSACDDKRVTISVADNGTGIPEENLAHLFTPFFTTKPVGQGTGLGLSISQGIVEEHDGTIEVDSTVGEGTVFTIKLPVVQ